MHTASQMNTDLPRPLAKAFTHPMRAIIHARYGTPDVLTYEEVERPVPGDTDVLVRVHAAGVSVGDHHIITGKPYLVRLTPYGGLPRPKNLGGARFDLMLDTVGNRSLSDCRSVVVPNGTFVSCSGGGSAMRWLFRMAQARLTSFFTSQKLVTLATSPNLKDLLFMKELVEAGKAKAFVDRRYGSARSPKR